MRDRVTNNEPLPPNLLLSREIRDDLRRLLSLLYRLRTYRTDEELPATLHSLICCNAVCSTMVHLKFHLDVLPKWEEAIKNVLLLPWVYPWLSPNTEQRL